MRQPISFQHISHAGRHSSQGSSNLDRACDRGDGGAGTCAEFFKDPQSPKKSLGLAKVGARRLDKRKTRLVGLFCSAWPPSVSVTEALRSRGRGSRSSRCLARHDGFVLSSSSSPHHASLGFNRPLPSEDRELTFELDHYGDFCWITADSFSPEAPHPCGQTHARKRKRPSL